MREKDHPTRWERVASGALVAACSFVSVAAQPGGGVIGTLTAATREEAVQCGRRGAACAVAPYELCPSGLPYRATLVTPFSRVASAVMDAEKNGRPVGRMGPTAVNRWGVSIQVSPAANSTNPESIERLQLRRGGRVIPPSKTTVGPITITMPDGSTRATTRGFFAFPSDAFEPSADLEIVFVGSSSESTCNLNRVRLQALR